MRRDLFELQPDSGRFVLICVACLAAAVLAICWS